MILLLDRYALLCLDGLVQPVRPAAPRHGPAGKFVDDHDLALVDDVVDVSLVQGVGAQRSGQMVHQANVGDLIQAVAFLDQPGPGQQLLHFLVPGLGQVSLLAFLVDTVITRRFELGRRRFRLHRFLAFQFRDQRIDALV